MERVPYVCITNGGERKGRTFRGRPLDLNTTFLTMLRKHRYLLLLTSASIMTWIGCQSPTDYPVSAGRTAYGVVGSSTASDYFYPHHKGYAYVYTNKLLTYTNGPENAPTEVQGANDTLRTLGHVGTSPDNDSLFAVSVTYRVQSGHTGRNSYALRYFGTQHTTGGAFIDGSTTYQGERLLETPPTRAVSCDSVHGAVYGRIRTMTDDFTSSSGTWQVDTIYFSASGNGVKVWEKNGSTYTHNRTIFNSGVTIQNNAEWSYSAWNNSTKFKVLDADASVTTTAGTYASVKIGVETASLLMPVEEHKFFGYSRGLIKQVNSWWTTSNGTSRVKQTSIREVGVVVIDINEVG